MEDGPGGLFHRGLILHRLQESPLGIEVLQRLGLLMIDLEPRLDGLGGIIFPLRFACPRTIGDFAQGLWSSLNPDNKVSLFARVIDLDSGETGDMIFNKYDAVCSDLDDPEEPELLPEELELLKKLDAEEKQD